MDKSEVRILVIDDDPTFGKSLLELFKRAGYETTLTMTPDQALAKAEHTEFQVVIADCVLPKMNGVDLVQKLLPIFGRKPLVILATGVFKDKAFIREAMAKTGALTLMSKPFQIERLLNLVEKELRRDFIDPELSPIAEMLVRTDCSTEKILQAMQAQPSLHGFQLPLVLSLFARQGMTGDLNVVSGDRGVSQITMIDGRVVDVRSQNPSSQLGELLIEFGFAMPDDVENALHDTSGKRPLGRRMVEASALSPHAVDLIREEQLAIRLSQLVQDSSIEVSWIKRDVEMKETFHALSSRRLKKLMSEWILSKISAEWLRTFYLQFADRTVCWRGKAAIKIDGAKASMPMLPIIIERLESEPTLQDLLVAAGENDLKCLQAVHALILERKIFFNTRRRAANDFAGKLQRYQRLINSFERKDFFQILGVSRSARNAEIQQAYTDLAKQFHPDKLASDSPPDLVELSNKIFAEISEAHQTIADETRRKSYLEAESRKEAGRIFALEPQFEAALEDLHQRKYKIALRKFEDLLKLQAPMPDLRTHYFWAKIKAGQQVTERDLFEIPPEHRHTATFSLVRGLLYRSQGKNQKAMECFQHARLMNRSLKEARTELQSLADELEHSDRGLHTLIHRFMGTKGKKSA